MPKLLATGLVLALALVSLPAAAKDLKIGVVDVEYVVIKSKKGKAAKKKLKSIFDKKQKDLNSKQERLLELKKKLENPSDMQSPDKRKKDLMEYQQGVLKLQEEFVKSQQELAKKEMDLMKPILATLEKVLTEHAKAGDYDMILTRSQHGVVFAKPALDITEEILKKMDGA